MFVKFYFNLKSSALSRLFWIVQRMFQRNVKILKIWLRQRWHSSVNGDFLC